MDVVYTQRPRVCSTSYLCRELMEYVGDRRDDAFFYLTINEKEMEQEDHDWLNSFKYRDRVKLVDVPTNRVDRLGDSFMLRNQLHEALHPLNRETWDIDVVVSSRIPVLKHYQIHSARPGAAKMCSPRMFVGIEEMPILPFRDTVPWHDYLYPDTLMSYGMTDATLINNQWTKKQLRPILREVLSPAWQKRILDKLHEVVPVKLDRFNVGLHSYTGGDFNVAFVGRMTSTRNFGEVAELFRKQFSFPLGPNKANLKFNISTNSQSHGASDPGEVDFIDIQMNDRPKFHEFLKHQHVAVNLTTVEDFSLSTYETFMAGIPVVVYDYPWNEFLGPNYPFRCKTEVEAYAMISAFAKDYSGMYQKFIEWEQTWWAAYVANPQTNVTTGEKLLSLIEDWEMRRAEIYSVHGNNLVPRIKAAATHDIFDLNKVVFEDIPYPGTNLALGRVPSTLVFKMVAERMGYRDTATTGVMKRE